MNIYSLPPLVSSLLFLIVGIFVFVKSPRGFLRLAPFLLTTFVTFWWQFSWFILFNTQNTEAAFLLVKIGYSGITFIPIAFFHFYSRFLDKKENKKWLNIYYSIAFVFLSLLWSTNLYVKGFYEYFWGFYPKAGILHPIFLTYLTVVALHSFCLLIIAGHKENWKGVKSNQIKHLLLSFFIYCLAASDFAVNYGVEFYPVGFLTILLCLGIVGHAIVKYRLMDVTLAITRAGIFIFVYTLVLGIPFGIGFKYLGTGLWLLPVILMTIFATAGPYLYFYLQKQAENKLLENQIAYQITLKRASYGIGKIKKLDTLIKLMNRILIRSVGIEQCAIYLIDQDEEDPIFNLTKKTDSLPLRITVTPEILKTLKKHSEPFIIEELVYHNPDNTDIKQMIEFLKTFQSEIVIPIVQSDKLLSLVLLGKKKDRSIYTNDDLTVFTILASQAGLAIENCLFMKAEKERLEREGASARRESLDMLVSTMAHEIDNPIQGAIGQAEMLKICLGFFRSLLPTETMDEVKQYCEKIESNCMRVSKIVKAVENYSKRETGHLKIVDLEEVITPFHSLVLMIQKKYKNVKYTEDIEGSFPPVRAEEIMIEEILMNLVENAYHAVIHNDGEKTVHLHVFKKDDNYVRIDVIDNGYGIASKVKNQLFQVPTTTKGSSEGTGLGLYRIRQICEILKAKYGVESEGRGSGALFYVELPIHHKTPINKEPADEQ